MNLKKRLQVLEQTQCSKNNKDRRHSILECVTHFMGEDVERLREFMTPWQLAALKTIPDMIPEETPIELMAGLLNEYQWVAMKSSSSSQAWLGTNNQIRGSYSNYVSLETYRGNLQENDYKLNSLKDLESGSDDREIFRKKYPHLFQYDEEMRSIYRMVIPHRYPDMQLPYELRKHYTVEDSDFSLYEGNQA